jgi:hypothetical protein
MVARRPRWEGEETRVLKAAWRSWEAGGGLVSGWFFEVCFIEMVKDG